MKEEMIQVRCPIPDGYELVRVVQGEHPTLQDGEQVELRFQFDGRWHFVIVRPAWQWPDWLTADWIARDADAEWWAFCKKPHAACGSWVSDHGRYFLLAESLVAFVPPPCTDWTQSLRRRPKAEVVK